MVPEQTDGRLPIISITWSCYLIANFLQEQHPEDVLLEIRGIHLPARDVRRREQLPLASCGKVSFRTHAVLHLGPTGSLGPLLPTEGCEAQSRSLLSPGR